jgi:hypothetical protein
MWMMELTTKTKTDESKIGSHSASGPTMNFSPVVRKKQVPKIH